MAAPKEATHKRWGVRIKLAVAFASAVVGLTVLVVAGKIAAAWMGIRDPRFRYENQIGMWEPDETTGFRNRPGLSTYCFGNVHIQTNAAGFRGAEAVAAAKAPQTTRIVGIGDSVMWGTGVNANDAFLGMLDQRLRANTGKFEVINAGVVGFSTVQELLYLEHTVLPALAPDVVLVNFCANDLLPTEDPFGNLREIYLRYLNRVIEENRSWLTEREVAVTRQVLRLFDQPEGVWLALTHAPPEVQEVCFKLFLDLPVRRMAELAANAGFRIVFLFIPPSHDRRSFRALAGRLRVALQTQRGEYLNLDTYLENEPPDQSAQPGWLGRLVRNTPLADLQSVLVLRATERKHATRHYLDLDHPTIAGNRIIADQIVKFLERTSAGRN